MSVGLADIAADRLVIVPVLSLAAVITRVADLLALRLPAKA